MGILAQNWWAQGAADFCRFNDFLNNHVSLPKCPLKWEYIVYSFDLLDEWVAFVGRLSTAAHLCYTKSYFSVLFWDVQKVIEGGIFCLYRTTKSVLGSLVQKFGSVNGVTNWSMILL